MHAAWTIRVRHRGAELVVPVHSDDTVLQLQEHVYQLTHVAPSHQKWLAQRTREGTMPRLAQVIQQQITADTTLYDALLRDGAVLTMLGATDDEVQGVHEQESAWARRHAPRTLHPSLLRGAKVRGYTRLTQPRSTATPSQLAVFGQLAVHPGTQPTERYHALVLRYLERLANDPAVLHVCRAHGYQVGTLTELLPHEHPNLLGLNENKGQRILLRIRTDAADGTRDYKTTRRVLMHELAHNEVLNSQLNNEVDAFERAQAVGTHRLQEAPTYEPPARSGSGAYTLGSSAVDPDELEERRARILFATETRLAKLDQEINAKCGDTQASTAPSASP